MKKTNAMRILESKDIDYNKIEYSIDDGQVDGVSVSKKIAKDCQEVYKTLVTKAQEETYVFVIPVNEHLDLKKAAQVTGEKKMEMVDVREILKLTGYERGGCSPIGMKRDFKTYIQDDSLNLKTIVVSAGKIGQQIELDPKKLSEATNAEFVDIIK